MYKLRMSHLWLAVLKCWYCFEAHIRDPNNVSHPIRNLHIVVHDMNNHPPQNVLARKLLNDVVSNSLPQHSADMMPNNVVTMGNHDLQLDGMHSIL